MGQSLTLSPHDRRPRLSATVSPLLARCRRQERSRWIAAVLRWLRRPSVNTALNVASLLVFALGLLALGYAVGR